MRAALLALSWVASFAVPGSGQLANLAVPELPPASTSHAPTGAEAYAIEAAGGVAGSLLGFGILYLVDRDCDVEDLSCNLETAALAIGAGTVGAAAGTYLAGRGFDTGPSALGAAVGAAAGAAAGIGVWHLLTEELNVVRGTVPVILSYTLTQGLVTALGSRLLLGLQ